MLLAVFWSIEPPWFLRKARVLVETVWRHTCVSIVGRNVKTQKNRRLLGSVPSVAQSAALSYQVFFVVGLISACCDGARAHTHISCVCSSTAQCATCNYKCGGVCVRYVLVSVYLVLRVGYYLPERVCPYGCLNNEHIFGAHYFILKKM